MNKSQTADLKQVREEFDAWRAQRTSQTQRIPETFWAAAVALLEHYPINVVSRELRLEYKQLKRRYAAIKDETVSAEVSRPVPETFLSLNAGELTEMVDSAQNTNAECRIVYETNNGSRLSISLPVDGANIATICAKILQV